MDAVLDLAQTLLSSPWLYALVLGVTMLDAVVPLVPGETLVITAAAYAVTGSGPEAPLVLLAAWAGALGGDVIAHHLGRGAGPLTAWLRRRRWGGTLFEWAQRELTARGGMLLISARFIPGGRTATTVASGAIGYPRARFVGFAAIAGLLWSLYSVGIGMLGGLAFHEQPLMGVALGIGLALAVGGSIEGMRALRARRRRRRTALSLPVSAARAASPAPARGA
ncbi:MAG: DedA family protein [Brachybacterium tyrofermentans]|uniref:DedA family protein n=1 Tax=Brachybacterium tyrofermentans TaxID=47848 RepID=UPI003FD3491B